MTAALMGAAVLTGCDKDKNELVVTNPGTTNTNPADPAISAREIPVTYELEPVMVNGPIARSTFDWVSAQGMVTDIKFEAKSDAEDVMYRSKTDRLVELFRPGTGIGDITVPAGTYDKIKYKINFASTPTYPALQLNGNLMRDGAVIPVRFVINDPVELKVQGQDVVVMENMPYLSTMMLQVMNLTQGITADMMDNATVSPNGDILISKVNNNNIYKIVWHNLTDDGFMKVQLKKKNKK